MFILKTLKCYYFYIYMGLSIIFGRHIFSCCRHLWIMSTIYLNVQIFVQVLESYNTLNVLINKKIMSFCAIFEHENDWSFKKKRSFHSI